MVTLPPPGIPSVQPAPPVAPPAVAISAQVISAEALIQALKQNVILPVIALQQQPAAQLQNQSPQLQVQTPQGPVLLQLPVLPNGQPLTEAQTQALLALKNIQIQFVPSAPAALPGSLPAAQLLIPTGDWQQIVRLGRADLPTTTAPAVPTPTAPVRFTATLLPPPIAAAFGVLPPTPQQLPAAAAPSTPVINPVVPPLQNFLIPAAISNFDQPGTSPLATLSVLIPDADTPAPTAALPLTAQIVGQTPKGDLLTQLESGETLLLPQAALGDKASLPIGEKLTLALLPPDRLASNPTELAIDARTPVLKEALEKLTAESPALVRLIDQQLVMKLAPLSLPQQAQPQLQLSGPLLFILSALGGSFRPAPDGKATPPRLHPTLLDAISRAGGPELIARLTGELQSLASASLDQQGYEWRSLALPTLMSDQVMVPLSLYIQRRQQDGSDGDPAGATPVRNQQTRFVVDLHLSQLGHTQLEGFSQPRQLDLLLRTDTPLPPALQQEISGQYRNIMEATGLSGALAFNRGNWLAFSSAAHTRTV